MAPSAARARFQGRSSAGWPGVTPAPDQAAGAPATPSPEMRGDPLMPPDTIEYQDGNGDVVGTITGLGESIDLHAASLGGARVTAFDVAALQLAPVDEKAIDLLWDWVRADRDGILNFIGFIPETSRALFKWMENFHALASKGMAWNQAIYLAGQLVGFVMLYPIAKSGATITGDCHIYLAKDVRGHIGALLPTLMAEADRLIPLVSLRVVTARDDEWVRLLRGVGFATQIVLTRPAASGGATNGV